MQVQKGCLDLTLKIYKSRTNRWKIFINLKKYCIFFQTRSSAHPPERGEPRMAQEGQQMAKCAFPS